MYSLHLRATPRQGNSECLPVTSDTQVMKGHTDWWLYFILGGTSRNFSKSDEQMTSTHAVLMIKTMGAALPQVFWFYCPIAPDLNHVFTLFFHFVS